jgi:hypothetical protein
MDTIAVLGLVAGAVGAVAAVVAAYTGILAVKYAKASPTHEDLEHVESNTAETAKQIEAVSRHLAEQNRAILRPVLYFTTRLSDGFNWIVLENQSGALALEVSAHNGTPHRHGKPIIVSKGTIAPGVEASLEGIEWGAPRQDTAGQPIYPSSTPVFARYKSQDGRWYRTTIDLRKPDSPQVVEEETDSPAVHEPEEP